MQVEELQKMTVIQLRKLAKENKVKLSAGIDKEGIVNRLAEALNGVSAACATENPAPVDSMDELQKAALACDVTSVQPSGGYRPYQQENRPAEGEQTGFRSAWQNRNAVQPRENAPRPAWQQPQRNMGNVNRFGPQQPARAPEQFHESSYQRQPAAYQPQQPVNQEPAPKLDGYRLGYRAAPQRPGPQNREGGYQQGYRNNNYNQGYNNNYRPAYRNNNSSYNNNYQAPPAFASKAPEGATSDAVYRLNRDPQFSEYAEGADLPDMMQLQPGDPVSGVLEILPDGYGFLRGDTLLPGKKDIYVSAAPIRRFDLRTGDRVEGIARAQRDSDKYAALLVVEKVNGKPAAEAPQRLEFEQLVPIYPNKRVALEMSGKDEELVIRLIDLIAPMGFGQRAMIITPEGADGLTLLRSLGHAVKYNDKDAEIMSLLLDVAPEDVTEFRENAVGTVFASTFADSPEMQARVSETMLERAMRLVEKGQNVVLLLDSLTKLTRAYQGSLSQGGRPMGNTVTPAALVKPKKFFGAARNTREGGSLTIIATINTETGSRTDDIIFEEFKGTANMEIALVAPQEGDPITPMVNLQKSGTKKDDALLGEERRECLRSIRKVLGSTTNGEAVIQLIDMMKKTRSNEELIQKIKEWVVLWEKSGYLKK